MLCFSINCIYISSSSLSFEKRCNDIFSILLIIERHDSHLDYNHYKTCDSSFADFPFTVVFDLSETLLLESL